MHHDVDPARLVLDSLEQVLDAGDRGDVGRDEQEARARYFGLQALLKRAAAFLAPTVEDDHRGAGAAELLGGGSPDAEGGHRDQRRLAREQIGIEHQCVSVNWMTTETRA